MKIIRRISTMLLAVALLGGPLISMAGNQGKDSGRPPRAADNSRDANEIRNREYMREEEKRARVV